MVNIVFVLLLLLHVKYFVDCASLIDVLARIVLTSFELR